MWAKKSRLEVHNSPPLAQQAIVHDWNYSTGAIRFLEQPEQPEQYHLCTTDHPYLSLRAWQKLQTKRSMSRLFFDAEVLLLIQKDAHLVGAERCRPLFSCRHIGFAKQAYSWEALQMGGLTLSEYGLPQYINRSISHGIPT